MNRSHIKFVLLLLPLFFVACGGGGGKDSSWISPTLVNSPHEGETFSLKIHCLEPTWTATPNDWCLASKTSGVKGDDSLKVTVLPNRTKESRSYSLVVQFGTLTRRLEIKQEGIPNILRSKPASINSLAQEFQGTLTIEDNVEWNITTIPSWLVINSVDKKEMDGDIQVSEIKYTVSANNRLQYRKADLVLKAPAENITLKIPVYQDGTSSLSTDSLALVDLYNAAGGAGWKNKWNFSGPVSTWYGVTVSEVKQSTSSKKRVTGLSLSNNNLLGSLPKSICDMEFLKLLWLDVNDLSGDLPQEIALLINLQSFRIGDNAGLTGTLSPGIGNISDLVYFSVYKTKISGPIPESFGNLTNLQSLELNDNDLSGSLPQSLGLLEINNLQLQNNYFSGVIPSSYKANYLWPYWNTAVYICPQKGAGFTNCQ